MTPQQIIFLSIVGIALVALIFLSESQKRYNLDSIKRKTVGDGQYGTARWATQEEIQSSTIQVPYEPEAWRHNKESRPTTAGIVVNLKQNKKQITRNHRSFRQPHSHGCRNRRRQNHHLYDSEYRIRARLRYFLYLNG